MTKLKLNILHNHLKRVPYTTLQNAFTLKYLPISRVTGILAKTLSRSRKIRAITIHVKSSRITMIQTCIHGSRSNKKLRSRSRKKT